VLPTTLNSLMGRHVDNIATYSETRHDNLNHIDKALQHVKDSCSTLTIKNSAFAKLEVKFMVVLSVLERGVWIQISYTLYYNFGDRKQTLKFIMH